MTAIVNTQQAEAWNGYEGAYWAEHQDRYDAISGGFNDALFAAAAIRELDHILDVGCGNGQTTRLAARQARSGHALGVDLSAPMLARARATAAAEGIANVTFAQGDAQVYPFPAGVFDVAISRGGVMFFADPVAAFANVGRALRPGGRLAFMCLQELRHNEWLRVLIKALDGHVAVPEFAAPGAPGMFSLADPTRVRDVLTGAGYLDVGLTPAEALMQFGRDADDAASFMLRSGPFRSILGPADQTSAERASDAVRSAFRSHEGPAGIRLRGAAWIVSAVMLADARPIRALG
jgi:SAM-dependent methyltransferase